MITKIENEKRNKNMIFFKFSKTKLFIINDRQKKKYFFFMLEI